MGQIDTNPAKQKRMADVPAVQDGLHSEKPRHLGSPVEPVRVKLQDPIGYLADGLLASNVWTSEGITGAPRLFQRRGPPSASNNSSPTDSPGHSTSSGDGSHKSPDTQPCDNQIEHLSPLDESVDAATDPRTSWLAQAVPDKTENDQISENQQLESSSFSLDMAEETSGSRGPNTHGSEFDWKGPSEDFARSQLGDVNPDTLSPASSPGKSGSLSDSSYDTDSGFPRQSSIHSRSSSRGDLQESESACLPPPPGLSLMDRIQEDFPRTPSPVFGSTFSSSAGMSATSRALQDRDNQVTSATSVLSQLRLGDFKEFTPQSSYAKYQVDDMVRQQHRCPLPEPGFASARSSHPFSPVAPVQPPFTSSLLASIQQSQSVSVSGYSQLGNPVPPPRWFPSEDRFATPSSPFLSAPTSLGGGTFGPPSGVNYRVNHGYVHESPFAIRPNDQMMKSHHLGAGFRDDPYDRVDLAYGRRPAYHRYKSPGGRRSDHEYFHPVAHSYSSNSLLEEFNSAPKSDRWELSTIKGHLLLFAKDQSGSRFIQQKLEKADERIKQEAFAEIYPNCLLLMTDVFGNYVIQKFLEYGTLHQQKLLVEKMTENMLSLALQVYGCRVIQRALEVTQVEEQLALIQQLHGHVMKCVVDQNGNHVLQKCVEAASWKRRMERGDLLSPLPAVQGSDIQFIIDSFVGHAASLSMHSYGCRVVQRVLEHCSPEQTRPILSEIIFKCRDLIKDQFGNYVVQHVVSHGDPEQRAVIKQTVFPEIARWSQHKYASNVVESCLEHASKAEISRLIDFILQCDETGSSCALLPMMKHMYGNYVVQKLMDRADECDRDRIVCIIRHNADYLKRFTFGKHVLGRLERAPSPPPAYY